MLELENLRRVFNKLKHIIKNGFRNLRWIVGGALGLVAGITLFSFAFIITTSIRSTLIDNSMTATEQSVHLTYLHLKDYHDELVQRGSTFSDVLQRVSSDEDELTNKMADIYHLSSDIVSVSIFNEAGVLQSYSPAYLRTFEEKNLHIYDWMKSNINRLQIVLSPPHLQDLFEMHPMWVVSLIKRITINNQPHFLVVDFDFSQVGDFFDRITIGQQGYAYITNREGEVLFHPKRAQFTEEISRALEPVLFNGDGTYLTHNEEYAVGYRTVSHTGWKVVGVSYLEDTMIPALNDITRLTIYTLIVMLVLIFITSMLLSKYISQPITRMVQKISQAEEGKTVGEIHETRFNEVRQLSKTYNQQMEQIHSLMEQIKQEQAELRKSEMNVLQAQINPHFLYNTLDSILWMAEAGQVKETSEMVGALGRLLRISLSKGENLISLRKELAHAKSYLTIQKIRYKDQFDFTIEADEKLLDYLTVKISIQPFLENALYHGIEHMVDHGHIHIKVFEKNENIIIQVSDDGVGISPEQLERIRELKNSKETGIGIRNVHQRIQVYFGEEYGVEIDSELDVGTTVTIEFPKILNADQIN